MPRLYYFIFFFFFFPCLKPAGLFHACNFAGTEGKARRFNAGENCFFWGGRKRLLAGLKCAGLLDLQSSRAHLRSQRAHMTYTHINTMYDSRAVVDEPRERERERRKKKSITVMIDFAAGWANLEPPCCSSNSRRIWEDVGVPLYAPIHSNPPRPTYKSHLRPVIQKKPSQLILRQFTQDNVTLHTRKPRRWKMCIRRAAVTYVSAVSAPSTHRRALNPSLNTVNAVRYREVQCIPNPFHHL